MTKPRHLTSKCRRVLWAIALNSEGVVYHGAVYCGGVLQDDSGYTLGTEDVSEPVRVLLEKGMISYVYPMELTDRGRASL